MTAAERRTAAENASEHVAVKEEHPRIVGPRTDEAQLMWRVLAYMEWHRIDDVARAVALVITPERARVYSARGGVAGAPADAARRRERGSRQFVLASIRALIEGGRAERDSDRIRFTSPPGVAL